MCSPSEAAIAMPFEASGLRTRWDQQPHTSQRATLSSDKRLSELLSVDSVALLEFLLNPNHS